MDLLERSHYVLLPMEWQLSPGQAACNSKVHGKHLRSWMLCPKLSPREPNSLSSWGVFLPEILQALKYGRVDIGQRPGAQADSGCALEKRLEACAV